MEIAQKGDQVAPSAWLNKALFRALLALGDFEQAEEEVISRFQTSNEVLASRVMQAAARRDMEQASAFFEEYLQDPEATNFWALLMYAWTGDKEIKFPLKDW